MAACQSPNFSRISRAFVLALLVFMVLPTGARATEVWEAHTGDPCCGVPDSSYKYLDAHEACRGEVVRSPDRVCVTTVWGTLRNDAGPQTSGSCVVDWICNCGECLSNDN